MGHKRKLIIFLILCLIATVGALGYNVEIITDNGGPLIDLNAQLVSDDLLLPEEEDNNTPTDNTTPVLPKKQHFITVKYDLVHFYGNDYEYTRQKNEAADIEETLVKKDGADRESFKDALKGYAAKEGINEGDVFVIKDSYGEYYTEQYVLACLKQVVDDDRITYSSDFR